MWRLLHVSRCRNNELFCAINAVIVCYGGRYVQSYSTKPYKYFILKQNFLTMFDDKQFKVLQILKLVILVEKEGTLEINLNVCKAKQLLTAIQPKMEK